MRILAAIATLLVSGCTLGPALFVERTGAGSGEVTSEPEGLHCGEDCALILDSEPITLVAQANRGSLFAGWSGGGCTGTDPCTLSLVADATVEAAFEPAFQPLLVTRSGRGTGRVLSEPAGIECGATCTASFREGSTVTLSAEPDAGSAFVGWSGACNGSGACTVPVELAATIDAAFAPLQTLTVVRAGDPGHVVSSTGSIDCPGSCTVNVPENTTVTLTAASSANFKFVGWIGGACSGTGPCAVTMTGPVTVAAVFVWEPNCTTLVLNSESAAAFNARLKNQNTVICLADGVTISGPVVIGADSVTIKNVNEGIATIENPSGTALSLARHDTRVFRVNINSNGSSLPAIDASGGRLVMRGSRVSCGGSNCSLVRLDKGSATIDSSTLTSGTGYSHGILASNQASATIINSTVDSYGRALDVSAGSTFSVAHSTLIGRQASTVGANGTLTIFDDARLELADSTVVTSGFRAIRAGGTTAGATVHLDGNTFRQMAGLAAGDRSPLVSERADNVFDSSAANTFCNEGTATDDLAFALPLIAGDHATMGTFDAVNQLAPGDCN